MSLWHLSIRENKCWSNPGYPTYTSLSKILGAEVINYDLKEDENWMPDFEALERMDLSRVKLMWTNYPNMPTAPMQLRNYTGVSLTLPAARIL